MKFKFLSEDKMIHSRKHFMIAGSVAFIPGWIMLFITILSFAVTFPSFFEQHKYITPYSDLISPLLLAFIIGSLMPSFDDLLAFIFGPPFAHHSVFHSLFGAVLTYIFFFVISNRDIAMFALLGNLTHIFFNAILDYVTFFFPMSYREFGLTDIIGLTTYQIKVFLYPLILIFFTYAVLSSFITLR